MAVASRQSPGLSSGLEDGTWHTARNTKPLVCWSRTATPRAIHHGTEIDTAFLATTHNPISKDVAGSSFEDAINGFRTEYLVCTGQEVDRFAWQGAGVFGRGHVFQGSTGVCDKDCAVRGDEMIRAYVDELVPLCLAVVWSTWAALRCPRYFLRGIEHFTTNCLLKLWC